MPRSSKKAKSVTPVPEKPTEPKTAAEVLEKSPVGELLASREAKVHVEPERPMPEPDEAVAAFQRQREREQAVPSRLETVVADALIESQKPKATHAERLKGLRPTPSGFVGLESFNNAGIRLSRSLDKNIVAIQFADDRRPSRDGLNPENQRLMDRGFTYRPERAQWERIDRQQPAENYQDAKAFVAMLVNDRLAGPGADVGRS